MKKSTKIVLGSVAGVVLIAGISSAAGGSDESAKPNDNSAVSQTSEPSASPAKKAEAPKKETSPLQEFVACVNKSGTATEKAAVKHVTKLTNMDDWNGILDNPKAWTDWEGGIQHTADANLITSAFAGCYKSDNGLITVYTADGHVAGTGNF